jgi:hypothetical protein
MLNPVPEPLPDPGLECIPVSVLLWQKVAVLVCYTTLLFCRSESDCFDANPDSDLVSTFHLSVSADPHPNFYIRTLVPLT